MSIWGYSMATGCADRPKRCQPDRSHNPWGEADRRAECGKTACSVRRGGGRRRVHGRAVEALPEETRSTSYAGPTGYRASPQPYLRGAVLVTAPPYPTLIKVLS